MKQEEEFEFQMAVARKVMRKDRRVLAALAEFDRTGKNSDWVKDGLKQKKLKD
ncbi:hypothetical protein [Sphingorhabdus sp. M41]|uniref:hypothetical protein n=1 Tax=Sphingorhabdus sp. M41 TaxID=1806885 RepID=UPI0012E8448C|nr:hypothetical protein [Sphingorhabdus sp. M41]